MSFVPDIPGARILIVDDQQANVRLLERLLADAGYGRVESTRDPAEACALHRLNDYDLILLDLQMPAMDGFSVMAALQAHALGDYLPVIVLTAQPGHRLRALQAGAKDFISKPFELLEVTTRVRSMLEVRLLYRKLRARGVELERAVAERTAALLESEARFRSLTELATDWYWEQGAGGELVKVSGPVMEMLGIRAGPLAATAGLDPDDGWDPLEREALQSSIEARRPFLDFVFHRTLGDGPKRRFRVSGQPMFDAACRFVGYRGIGVEVPAGL